jgi:5-bromo-4-chloroindolyl phosphate hydrolysis protein
VNERIRAVSETSEHMEFLCECADLDCTETLNLTVAEYERIRNSPVRFPIAVGHDFPEIENVVEDNERYVVVQKRGEAGEEAAKLDPRS